MNWFGRLFRKRRMERELDAELGFHVEYQIRDNIKAGMDEAEARRKAAIVFGGLEQVKEDCREARGTMYVETTRQDLQYAFRTLRHHPAFTLTAILTLALGIGGSAAMFSVVQSVLLSPLPYVESGRLVTLAAANRMTLNPTNVSFGESREWSERNRSLEGIALYRNWQPTLTGETTPRVLTGRRVSHNFFSTLGVRPILGRDFVLEEDQPERWRVLLLSYSLWQTQFGGDPSVIGRTIHFNELPYEVIGILPQDFKGEGIAVQPPDVWAPLGYGADEPFACRSCWHLRGLARIRNGVTLDRTRQDLNRVAQDVARAFPDEIPKDQGVQIRLLQDNAIGDVRSTIWLLFAATGVVLLIACANVTNLLLARSATRGREIALRLALGASRIRIVRQLVTESAVLSLAAATAGLIVAAAGMKVLLRLAPLQIPRLQSTQLDMPVLLGAIVMSILTGFAIGLAPAFYATRSGAADGSRVHGSAGYRRLRSLVVISEIALAVLLTVSTGLLVRSLLLVLNVNPGFAVEQLHTFTISMVGPRYAEDEPVIAFQRSVLERVKALPGVEHAAMVSTLPIGGGYDRRGFHIRDRAIPSAEAPDVDGYYVTPDYFSTMQIPIIKGRGFVAADEAPRAPPVALISERASREYWPGEDPIGKGIQLGGRNEESPWATIVGIAGDVRQYGLDAPATPQAYLLYTQGAFSIPQLLVRSTLENEMLARSVEREIWALDKTVPVRTAAMEDVVAASLAQRRFTLGLLGGFAALSLLLAVVGIYGVMAYSVAQRTKELGVRMALGAQRKQIFAEVIRQGLGLTVIGLIGGFIAALAVTRLLGGWLFGITPTDVVTFSLVAILIVIVATLASIVPARRAIRVDPAAALRWD